MRPHTPTDASASEHDVRHRILDAAESLFAASGYASTSVREITRCAEVNLAAVSYYFGGKAPLYREVYRRRLAALRDHRVDRLRLALAGAGQAADLTLVLETFAEAFLEPLVEESRGRQTISLIAHEILNPHLPPGVLEEEMMRPTVGAVVEALHRVAPGLEPEAAFACVHSLVGQLIHAVMLRRRAVETPMNDLAAFVRHIVRFSAAGIRAYAREEP